MHFDLLKKFVQEGPLTVIVDGECMQRTIPEGSRLRLESKRKYWPGDVVAFKRGDGKIVCHRFLGFFPGRSGWSVITRAENSKRADKPAYVRYVLGKVAGVDDELFSAGMKDRAMALMHYFPAIMRQLVVWFGASDKHGGSTG